MAETDNARLRWIVLTSALGLTLAAAFYPTEDAAMSSLSTPSPRLPPLGKTVVDSMDEKAVPATDEAEGSGNPFAPRGWTASPPPALAPVPAALAVAPVDLTVAGPPELPFRFVGSFNDGAEQAIYLARGEQSYVARVGEVIETSYKVLGVTQTQIEFEHIPTGVKQALLLPVRDN